VFREKAALEQALAHEHEEHAAAVALLSAQFSERLAERTKLKGERCALENTLEAEQEAIIHRMGTQLCLLQTERAQMKRELDRIRGHLRSCSVSRSVSPALRQPSPAASPRGQSQDGGAVPPPAPLN
jgi:uncharacterized coiled-coil protein SlyX